MFPSSWGKLVAAALGKKKPLGQKRWRGRLPRFAFRPAVEVLEDRLLLATLSMPTNLTAIPGGSVFVPIDVDTLNDTTHGQSGLSGGTFVVYYNPAIFTVANADVVFGSLTNTGTGWSVAPNTTKTGVVSIVLATSGKDITTTGGGSLVIINFQVKSTAALGLANIDLMADNGGASPTTTLQDQTGRNYTLATPPVDNTVLTPSYAYTGTDPDDGAVTITAGGTWQALANAPSSGGSNTMMLLTDGTVLMQGGTTNTWYQLTPDSTGSYANGTWRQLASMNLQRLYFGSNVLPTGNVFVVGGEYAGANNDDAFTNTGEIYNPLTNSWLGTANFPQSAFGDDPTETLPNGNILGGYVSGPQTNIYNPATNTWSPGGTKLLNDRSDEETWLKLPDGSILCYDVFASNSAGVGHAQRYVPATNTWVDAGIVPVLLSNSSVGDELGPAFLLPDGRALFLGANGNTAFYTPSTNSWTAGPVIPNGLVCDDAPGAMMANGHILFSADSPVFQGPTTIFEFDPVADTFTDVSSPDSVIKHTGASFVGRMLDLPTGQILFSDGPTTLALYSPLGSPSASGKPTISSVSANGDGSFTLTGTQLNGISEGASYGDDAEMASNYPIVRLVGSNGKVAFARTFNWSSTGVATGSAVESTEFTLPAGFTVSGSTITVSASGIASASFSFVLTNLYFAVKVPVGAKPGTSFTATVTALDQNNNTNTAYAGTVNLTSSDAQAVLPASATLTSGSGAFNVTLKTDGNQTLTATDTTTSAMTGTSLPIDVNGAVTHLVVTGPPGTLPAGNTFYLTVTAEDQFNDIVTDYRGTVHFTKSDGGSGSVVPANYTFTAADNGVHVFALVALLVTAGIQTVTATDTATSTITGNTTVSVTPAAVTHLSVTAPSSSVAGNLLVFTVTPRDTYNNIATGYSGTVHFTSTDGQAVLQINEPLGGVTAYFAADLLTAGNQTITATDTAKSTITGTSGTITVSAAALSQLTLTAPATAMPGTTFKVTVTAQDQYNNTITGYAGTVHFASSDTSGNLPANTTLASGTGTFNVTLKTAGNQTITVTDTVTSSLTDTGTVAVSISSVNHFAVAAPSASTAGNPIVIEVTAKDQFNNTITGYNGTVHFISNDSQATLPANTTLTGGVGFFAAILRTAGNDTLAAIDTVTPTINGTSGAVVVSALAVSHFTVSAAAGTVAGSPVAVTVTAKDTYNNIAASYSGIVQFTSTDPQAILPPNTALTGGTGTFSVTFRTSGSQTITASDTTTPSITGTSSPATIVASLIVTSITNDGSSFTVNFNESFVAADINLYDLPVPGGLLGPTDVTLTSATASPANGPVSYHGTLILNDPIHPSAFTFVKTSSFNGQSFNPVTGMLTTGTYTVTLRSASNGFHDAFGNLLTDANGIVGNNFVTTFVINGPAPAVVGVPSFARGPSDSVFLPNNAAGAANQGIPINLGGITNAQGVTSGSFTLVYNPQLLTITGATGFAGNGVTLNVAVSNPGTATVTFTSTAALPDATASAGVRLGILTAVVPDGAASSYADKAQISFTSASLNGGIPIIGDDSVEVAAYLGDVNGDSQLSGGDAALIAQVGNSSALNGTLPGFTAYRLADPVILADLSGNGSLDASDETLINSFLAGTTRAQVPPVNPNGLTITAVGPDPVLSMPSGLAVSAGSTVVVPVNIDTARPDGSSGMTEAVLALQFDPTVFTVTPADIHIGTVPGAGSGWHLETAVNAQTGAIGIDLFSSTPILATTGGSLVTITVGVRGQGLGVSEAASEVSLTSDGSGFTPLSLVNEVNPTGQRSFQTAVSDSLGALVVHTAVVDGGRLTVVGSDVVDGGRWTVDGKAQTASSPSTVHRVPFTEPVVQDSVFDQVGAILNSDYGTQPETWVSDQALLQQVGVAQDDWVPADLVVHLEQATTADRSSLIGAVMDGAGSDNDGADLTGLEEFFAHEAAPV